MRRCFQCGAELPPREKVPFKELCPNCEAFLHCCKNCRLYSSNAHNHCLSSTTEYVSDVEHGNYCDEFEFREVEGPKTPSSGDKSKSARPSQSKSMSARQKFNNLFKD